jgi:hypothetical protein
MISPATVLIRVWSLAALGVGLVPAVFAQPIVFPNFSSTPGLTLSSSATTTNSVPADGTVLRLVTTAPANDTGSVFTSTTLSVATGFSTSFDFRLTSRGGITDGTSVGADGIVFAIQRVGPTALGNTGEGLGYESIGSSIGVEFDTYRNVPKGDPNSNHVGVNAGGSVVSVVTANVTPDFDSASSSGPKWTAWIDYNGSVLEVRAAQDGIRPGSALISHSINLASTLGGSTAHVGFTAATGGANANHDLLSWVFSDSYSAGGVTMFHWSGTGVWSNPSSWNPAAVPGATDVAFVSAGTASVNDSRSLGAIQLSGGTLAGTGTLTLTGGASNWTAGNITIATLNSTGDTTISGTDPKSISDGASVNLTGTTTWAEGTLQTGGGAIITNAVEASFTATGNNLLQKNISGTATFINDGLFTKSTGTGTTTIEAGFENSGTVNVNSGTLRLAGDGRNEAGGTISVAAAGELEIAGDLFEAAPTSELSGNGRARFMGGTFLSDTTIAIVEFDFDSGVLAGTNEFSGIVNWNGGNWSAASGSHTTTIAAGGLLNLGREGSHEFNRRSILNLGIVNWQTGDLRGGNGSVFTNEGVFNDLNGGTKSILAPGDFGGAFTFTNNGIYTKSTGGTTTVEIGFINNGGILVSSGSLIFAGAFTNAGYVHLQDDAGIGLSTPITFGPSQPLTGTGTIDAPSVTAEGLVSPGVSPGQLTLTGDLTLESTSLLLIELQGPAQGAGYDFVSVGGNATLGGQLALTFLSGYESSVLPEHTFTVLSAEGLSGLFTNVANGGRLLTLDGAGSFQINYGVGSAFTGLTNHLVLSDFQAIPEPSTWVLLGFGAFLIGLRLHRRR